MNSPAVGYGISGCGCLLSLIGMAVATFGGYHVFLDPGGRISGDEAAPALLGGSFCSLSSVLIVAVGLVLVLVAKRAQQAPIPEGDPGAPQD